MRRAEARPRSERTVKQAQRSEPVFAGLVPDHLRATEDDDSLATSGSIPVIQLPWLGSNARVLVHRVQARALVDRGLLPRPLAHASHAVPNFGPVCKAVQWRLLLDRGNQQPEGTPAHGRRPHAGRRVLQRGKRSSSAVQASPTSCAILVSMTRSARAHTSTTRRRRIPRPGRWPLQDAKAHFSELVRRAQAEGAQHVTVHGREVAVLVSAEEFHRLKGDRTGKALVDALRASPHRRIAIEPARTRMPVRDVKL
jgi:prevent-host-death family protein